MAVNYATNYSKAVDERFTLGAQTNNAINRDYDWAGAKTVTVFGMGVATMNDYTMNGQARYGVPAELDNTVQEMTLTKDRSFTFTIDQRNYNDTQMTMEAGKALRRQIDEVIIPEIDTYRLSKIVAGAGTNATPANIDKSNAYEKFLDGTSALINKKVPLKGLVAYVSTNFYKQIKLDSSFIKASDLAQEMLIKGQVGAVDGVPIVYIPDVYLPNKVEFVITHPMATTAVEKLVEYKTHENPPGINGWLVEGRIYYDAFVLNNKKGAIYVHKNATV